MPTPEPTARWADEEPCVRTRSAFAPPPSSPQADDAKKHPNADGADKADWPMAGILGKPPGAGFEHEILGLR